MEYLTDLSHQSDPYRPSLFELAAQDQLRDLLSPVVRYVLSVFAQRNPRHLLRLVNSHDELFALCMFLIERHYLVHYSTSFAEYFYGLKRRRVLSRGGGGAREERTKAAFELMGKSDRLGKREVRGSLVFLVLLPYLRTKAQDWYERLGGGADADLFDDNTSRPSLTGILRDPSLPLWTRLTTLLQALFKRLYPHLNLLYELYLLVFNLRYLFGKSPFWRPWFQLLGIEVRRMGQEDYQALSAAPSLLSTLLAPPPSSPPSTRPPLSLILRRLLALTPRLALDSLSLALPMAIFGFRFLEWWYSPAGGAGRLGRGRGKGEVALRAPRRGGKEKDGGHEKGQCPVHGGPIENPTALPSGWVGCYKCLRGLEEEGQGWLTDPRTGERVELARLRKIND
ncbi:hypothetical protein JCM1841_004357 [Sporobolomyces salmonicolor]